MEQLQNSVMTLAASCKGNPVTSTLVVILFFVFFNIIEASVEKLIFGERFEHWLDPIFGILFIAYGAYAVWACAVFNSTAKS
jgi:threonine/homoserine/homoserine lactone efflux protein